MDRDVDVRTPESIALTYSLAGLGSRFLAVALDLLVQAAVLAALLLGIAAVLSRVPNQPHPATAEKLAGAILVALVVAVLFAIFFGYFIVFEAAWNGQTPGKRALGIRVVRDGGYPIDFGASLIRNLIRVAEALIGFYAASAVSALLSRENKRLGDIAAGTIVVRDASLDLAAVVEKSEPVYASTLYLSGEERALIARFLERRDALDGRRRCELASNLAARIRSRVPPDLARLDDEALLERL
ncbi:MAG TPA: RDD family protein [Candidatus Acidoferrales bacterium]|nr:RDD family protein [Candidatus Acidoferrales bacterium]